MEILFKKLNEEIKKLKKELKFYKGYYEAHHKLDINEELIFFVDLVIINKTLKKIKIKHPDNIEYKYYPLPTNLEKFLDTITFSTLLLKKKKNRFIHIVVSNKLLPLYKEDIYEHPLMLEEKDHYLTHAKNKYNMFLIRFNI